MLILALMLMMSFNVSNAIHEKVRLQNYSDAKAYSMAVAEARAFNYIAYTNRAMAATYVTMMSLHAYMASASVIPDMLNMAAINFIIMGAMEFGWCCACTWCTCVNHCIEGIEDFIIAYDYYDAANDYEDKVKGLESSFRLSMMMLELMVNSIHFSQLAALERTGEVLLGDRLDALKGAVGSETGTVDQVAPRATDLPAAVGALNIRELACAVEAPPLLSMAAMGCPSVSRENRSKVMSEVANATRPDFAAERPFFPYHLNPLFLKEFMLDLPDDGISVPLMHDGTSKLIDSTSTSQLHDGNSGRKGTTVGADEHGWVFSYKDHAAMILPYSSEIFSDEKGGKHKPSATHEDDHTFDGVNAASGFSCLFNNNCFIKFRANPKKGSNWGQPRVYSYTTQDLSLRQGDNGAKPWEITESGDVSFSHGDQGDATLTMKSGIGLAMSKAMVYYHRLGDWKEQPNLFNPYWRAKMHHFDTVDAGLVLGAAGQGAWAGTAALGGATGALPLN